MPLSTSRIGRSIISVFRLTRKRWWRLNVKHLDGGRSFRGCRSGGQGGGSSSRPVGRSRFALLLRSVDAFYPLLQLGRLRRQPTQLAVDAVDLVPRGGRRVFKKKKNKKHTKNLPATEAPSRWMRVSLKHIQHKTTSSTAASPVCLNSARSLSSWNMHWTFFLSRSCCLLNERCRSSSKTLFSSWFREVMVDAGHGGPEF